MTGRARRLAAVALAVLASGQGGAVAGSWAVAPPSRDGGATVAKVVVATEAWSRPGGGAVAWRVPIATAWGSGPQELLVLRSATDGLGRRWVAVRLPIRPGPGLGWIRADDVRLLHSPYWIDVSLGERTVSVYRSGRLLRRVGAVVGAPSTATPVGLHAVYDPIAQEDASGFLGPWAIHLTAVSPVLDNYGGGPGRIAIHGRGGASLLDPLGTARSHGCIRIDNAAVDWLATTVPRGTPVLVRP